MATMKVIPIFNDNAAGWSESYYLLDADADPDVSYDNVMTVMAVRSALLASGDPLNGTPRPFIEAVRVSNVDVPNQSALFPPNLAVVNASNGNPKEMMGTRTARLNVYSANKVNKRALNLRGIPDAWLSGDLNDRRSPVLNAQLWARLQRLGNRLKGQDFGLWGIRHVPWISPLGVNVVRLVSVDTASGRWVISAPGLVFPLDVTQRVRIRGFKGRGLAGLNRQAKIVAYNPTTGLYILSTRPCSNCRITIRQYGVIEIPGVTTYARITQYDFGGYGQHVTGRSFFARPGRRSKRGCCRL